MRVRERRTTYGRTGSRRMRLMLASVLMALLIGLLAACGSDEATPTPGSAQAAPTPTISSNVSDIAGTGGTTTETGEAPEYGGILTFARRRGTASPDPYSPAGGAFTGWIVTNSMVQQKFPFDPSVGVEIEPNLAREYSQTGDGSKWVFKLRQGVTWHDGELFNADDIIATYQRALDPDVLILPRATSIRGVFKGVRKIDDYTVELDTGVPNSAAFAWIINHYITMLPEHMITGDPTSDDATKRWKFFGHQEGETGTLLVGTGPFTMKSNDPEVEMILERNPNYWKRDKDGNQLPYLDGVHYPTIADGTRSLANFASGRSSFSMGTGAGMHPDKANELCKSTRDKECYTIGWPHGYFAWLENPSSTPQFEDPRIVSAVRYSMNMDEIFKLAYGGRQGYMWMDRGRFPDTAISVKEQYELLPWSDPARRREFFTAGKDLMTEAGFPKGFDLPFPIFSDNLCRGSFLDQYSRMVDAIFLLGVRGILECREGIVHKDEVKSGRWSIDGPGDSIYLIDPGYSLYTAALLDSAIIGDAPWRYAGQEEMDAIYRTAVVTVDETARNEMFKEIERYMANPELTNFPAGYSTVTMSVHGCVKNFRPGGTWDSGNWSFEAAWLEKECR